MAPSEHALRLQGIRKSFGGTEVLHGVDLDVRWGEFIGFMGPNGAGKSTLIKILAGVHAADGGVIEFDGRVVSNLGSSRDVGFVHQDLGLVDDMSVLDNIRLGAPPLHTVGPLLDRRGEADAARAALRRVELDVPLGLLVADLSPGEKALVAVARLLDRGARLIIVDEATSTLPVPDARRLMAALEHATENGATVVFVSHKLSEILEYAHRVLVLIDGSVAADDPIDDVDRSDLVSLLMAVEAPEDDHLDPDLRPGDAVLEMRAARGPRTGPIDLIIHQHEAVGLTGLPGSGMYEIALMAAGHVRPASGQVLLRRGRCALVPPQRERHGIFHELAVGKNLTISALNRFRGLLRVLRLGDEEDVARRTIRDLSVVPQDLGVPVRNLSGGNQQKIVFGRALLRDPDLYVLCEPTRGVDVGTRREIYRLIANLKADGAAVLVVSSDAEDLFAVCDRVAAVEDGMVPRLWDRQEHSTDVLARLL